MYNDYILLIASVETPTIIPLIMPVAVVILIAGLAFILVVGIIILCCRQKVATNTYCEFENVTVLYV